jgi:hypothetical protein
MRELLREMRELQGKVRFYSRLLPTSCDHSRSMRSRARPMTARKGTAAARSMLVACELGWRVSSARLRTWRA